MRIKTACGIIENHVLEVVSTANEFLFSRLPIPKFFISQWLHVSKFQEGIENLKQQGSEINSESLLPLMSSILNEVSGDETIDGVSTNTLAKGFRLLKQTVDASDMDDVWFVKKFGQIYERVMALRTNEDFVVNPVQMDKFLDLVSFFMRKASEFDDDFVEIEKTEPKQEFGGVTATFVVFSLVGQPEVSDFCKVLRCCSAVSIDATTDSTICISCTVPNVFVHK